MSGEIPTIALRPLRDGRLDDVVVKPVEVFRAEILDATDDAVTVLWLCCYLPNGDRITWHIQGEFDFHVTERPENGYVDYDSGERVSGWGDPPSSPSEEVGS